MPAFLYEYGEFQLEVTAPNEAALDMRDVYGDGSRRSFDNGGKVVVNLGLQSVVEERGATLPYRVLKNGIEVFSASGGASRIYRGGQRGRSPDPVVYSF